MLPHFCSQDNYEDLKPTDNPSEVPTLTNSHMLNTVCAHHPFESQCDPIMSLNSLVSPCLHSGAHIFKGSADDIRAKDYQVDGFKLISSLHSKTSMTEHSIPGPIPAHVAYSPLASMNHGWTFNLHDRYILPWALIPGESIPTSHPTICILWVGMFTSGVDYTCLTREPHHDLPSLASSKGEMASSFSLTHPEK